MVGDDDDGQCEELVIGWERQGNNPYFILAKVEGQERALCRRLL